ncbi:MAG: TetR/AcrR family transcriptional regulator, mexCD-oprJ operon repressor [Solirubrobacteraceae bacterium]|jgi:AcrR family transcriptional regulator|nr:TetR/AcrR family transcriptional regulator, mexCD-oprJ operon repressor [Solirubrobacteraceae bacterium]
MSQPGGNAGVAAAEPTGDRARRVDARRNVEAIIEAAARVLADRPRASMQQIAEAAGLHRATVHRHFASRDDLLDALRDRTYVATLAALERSLDDPSGSAGDALERATRAMLEVGDHYRLYRYTSARVPEVQRQRAALAQRLITVIEQAQQEGALRNDLPAAALLTAYGGLLTAALDAMGEGDMDAVEGAAFIRRLLGPS